VFNFRDTVTRRRGGAFSCAASLALISAGRLSLGSAFDEERPAARRLKRMALVATFESAAYIVGMKSLMSAHLLAERCKLGFEPRIIQAIYVQPFEARPERLLVLTSQKRLCAPISAVSERRATRLQACIA
jgi:hypothetical protein